MKRYGEDTVKGEGKWTCKIKLVRDIWCSCQWFARLDSRMIVAGNICSKMLAFLLLDVWTDL